MSRTSKAALAAFAAMSTFLALAEPAQAARTSSWPDPVPVVTRIDTQEPVVFITLDDGWNHDPAAQRLLLERRIPASLFINPVHYSWDKKYYQDLLNHGPSRMENHTLNHVDLPGLSPQEQRAEICGARDRHLAAFGDSPRLFRPPSGRYDEETRRAARACGAKALVTWTHDATDAPWNPNPELPELRPGDIILLHLGNTAEADLRRVLDAVDASGLRPAQLRDHAPDRAPAR